MSTEPHIDALIALGMTPIEAAVYGCLVQNPGSTGYRVSRAIHKPTANTYKALASLEGRGAVTVGGGARRLYSAVEPDELLDALERRFRGHRREAARGLAGLQTAPGDDGFHHLQTSDQVVARLRRMLGRCRSAAILDLGPAVLERVKVDLVAAADGGAEVIVKVYRAWEIEGVACVLASEGPANSSVANAVVDGREMMLASIDGDGGAGGRAGHAVWSARPHIVAAAHRALVAELLFAEVEHGLDRGISIDELEDTFAVYQRLRALSAGEGGAG